MAEIKVAKILDIEEGKGKIFEVEDKSIAVFKSNGRIYAIDNTCLHAGGSLSTGVLTGGVVTCPLHGWQYDIKSGDCVMPGGCKVNNYKVIVKGEDVFVEV